MIEARLPTRIEQAFADGTPIDDGINEGIRDAMIRHKRLGQSVVAWRDGKVVWLKPHEIPVDDDGGPVTAADPNE